LPTEICVENAQPEATTHQGESATIWNQRLTHKNSLDERCTRTWMTLLEKLEKRDYAKVSGRG
jgi:hypothetical protein